MDRPKQLARGAQPGLNIRALSARTLLSAELSGQLPTSPAPLAILTRESCHSFGPIVSKHLADSRTGVMSEG